MKTLGDPIFARDETGRLKSRVGTVFLRTLGLVTLPGIHATQRSAWLQALNRERAQQGRAPLSEAEEDAELAHSVDLLFTDAFVLIRPDPYAMPLAFEADELLQSLVTKRKIRYLNTHDERVRDALCARGENWRMSRIPCASEEMNQLIAGARTAIGHSPLYFYNPATGTRFLTLDSFRWLDTLPDGAFRAHLAEIAAFSSRRNRLGHPEIDIFPPACTFTRQAFEALDAVGLPDGALRAAYRKLLDAFREAVPAQLRHESPSNIAWRNQLFSALTSQPNAVAAEEIIPGISGEFYRQIEWLAGVRIDSNGELLFDPLFDEAASAPDDPELLSLCDPRAKKVLFNYLRELSDIESINIGRIARSLSRRPHDPTKRPNVYVVQVKQTGRPAAELHILRFQKWSIQEHLDSGKTELRAITEAADYIDYVFDRRLGCRQLGMPLPAKVTIGRIRETYAGSRAELRGREYWAVYFIRSYIKGCASDKLPTSRYADPEYNRRFAHLLGDAAAINLIVGRVDLTGHVMFDDGDEVIVEDAQERPERLIVSDHTGAFTDYITPLADFAQDYADPVNRRAAQMPNAGEFATLYLTAFLSRFVRTQQEYAHRRRAFDSLFKHLPVDPNGSFAYRWRRVLARLMSTDAADLAEALRSRIGVLKAAGEEVLSLP